MSQLYEVLHYIQALRINPLAGVIVAALLAAFLEQRRVRGRTPDFNAAYRQRPVWPNLSPKRRRRRQPPPAA
ncbi:hypothetical protein [Phenylobacterium sp.]|jgi:hypothetical protein|uniref:hypothetical protein n=1 Tax=Phenylobacterium sp. TaxID=1871053 RepID=UPI002E30B45D|nr:hypothetical protein [Phenylobacterium sp.]HEX4709288.1 hypothetical protein [Phenylobacterium sp.]